jgi:hypothetical protein
MKKLFYVILLLSVSAFCFGHNNIKSENKLFGLAKCEISSEIAKVSETSCLGQIGDVTTFGDNVIGYMSLNEDGYNQYTIYAETEGHGTSLLEVQINTYQGTIGYNSRSDGGWLVWVEVSTNLGLGYYTGTHKATISGTTYTCQTSL